MVDDPSVSALQAEVRATPEGVHLLDNESRNGTFVGGNRIIEMYLKTTTEFACGRRLLRFLPIAAVDAAIEGLEPPARFGPLVRTSPPMRHASMHSGAEATHFAQAMPDKASPCFDNVRLRDRVAVAQTQQVALDARPGSRRRKNFRATCVHVTACGALIPSPTTTPFHTNLASFGAVSEKMWVAYKTLDMANAGKCSRSTLTTDKLVRASSEGVLVSRG